VAYLKAIFTAAGYKVHSYTSPHLITFNERIILSGSEILDDYLFQVIERTRIVAQKNDISNTFFEGVTAAAFLAFSETPADVLILETGIGGRLDATNVVSNPVATIITPISYDHMQQLGPTLPIIAGEKAGIIKQSVPCAISAQVPEVMEVFLGKCEELNAPSVAYGYDFAIQKKDNDSFAFMRLNEEDKIFKKPNLLGDHQILNAATVIASLGLVKDHFDISDNHINLGLSNVIWPGRLQNFSYFGRNIWLDSAHNSGGAQVLALWMRENLPPSVTMILGMTKNRNVMDFVTNFRGIVDKIICVQVTSEPSSYKAQDLLSLIDVGIFKTEAAEDLDDAMNKALKTNGDVIVTGSIFFLADLFKKMR
jgi:dihydrofolate synthase/folylpolyglutamate synthase